MTIAPLIAQAAPVAADAVATAAPDLLTVGGGALGGLGGVGGLALLGRWLLGTVEQRMSATDARVAALEGQVATMRLDLAVAAERDRSVRELLMSMKATLERDR